MVSEKNRLGLLQMGVPRDDHAGVTLRLLHQLLLQDSHEAGDRPDCLPHPEPLVERDLVVAAASRVELPSHRADLPNESGLDRHVNVLSLEAPPSAKSEPPPFDLALDVPEGALDFSGLLYRDNPPPGKHLEMADAPF